MTSKWHQWSQPLFCFVGFAICWQIFKLLNSFLFVYLLLFFFWLIFPSFCCCCFCKIGLGFRQSNSAGDQLTVNNIEDLIHSGSVFLLLRRSYVTGLTASAPEGATHQHTNKNHRFTIHFLIGLVQQMRTVDASVPTFEEWLTAVENPSAIGQHLRGRDAHNSDVQLPDWIPVTSESVDRYSERSSSHFEIFFPLQLERSASTQFSGQVFIHFSFFLFKDSSGILGRFRCGSLSRSNISTIPPGFWRILPPLKWKQLCKVVGGSSKILSEHFLIFRKRTDVIVQVKFIKIQ